jgi:hypothetical protein
LELARMGILIPSNIILKSLKNPPGGKRQNAGAKKKKKDYRNHIAINEKLFL